MKLGLAVSTIMIFGFMNPVYTFRKEFRYYLAKECFLVSNECFLKNQMETDENKTIEPDENKTIETTKYILLGLHSYNAYLRRNIGLQISNIDRIYSIITSNKLYKLKLVRYLRDMSVDRNKNDDEQKEEFLVTEKLRDKISSLSAWLIPIITVLVSIYQLFIGPSSP
jgi:hypothetical protein